MAGLTNEVLSAGTLTNPNRLNDLVNAVGQSVVIDQGWDLLGFAEQMSGLSGGQVEFRTMPVERLHMDTPEGSAVGVDPTQIRQFFSELVGVDGSDIDEQDAAETTVNVMNTTSAPGLAADVSAELIGEGFTEGDVANAAPREQTVLRHAQGEETNAEQVAEALDGPSTQEEDPALAAGEVTVLLGNDFPAGQPSAEAGNGSPPQAPEQQQQQEEGDEPPAPGGPDDPDADADPEPGDDPITADGVTCVN